jgi:sodium-dependent phosphate cotransporter
LEPVTPIPPPNQSRKNNFKTVIYIIATLVLFVFALDLMVSSLQHIGKSAAETIIQATSNPFTALFIGLLITAMIQSSSTTTALVVALVASGSITIESAIPIIMGANVGTTITSTIVSLGFINKKKEFRRAAAAATYYGFFNILSVVILFPLEYYYGFLSGISQWIATYFFHPASTAPVANSFSQKWYIFGPVVEWLVNIIPSGFLLAALSFILIFTSILVFRKLISGLLLASSPERFSRFFFKNAWKSFFWGTITTAAIRSSTITTSVVVPIVAQRIVSLRKAAPFILGANIGTTITAFLAAFFNTNTAGAISIAIAHFLFNFIGVLIFYPIPILRKIPLELANWMGRLTLKYRLAVFVYILMIFFFIPFSLIYLNKDSIEIVEATYQKKNILDNTTVTYALTSKIQTWNKTGQMLLYNDPMDEPSMIFPVYRKNNILFINNEMFLFNAPGFCWDGEQGDKKYRMCVDSILPVLAFNSALTFDSVYVYSQEFYNDPDSARSQIYLSKAYPLVLKRERSIRGRLAETEEITGFIKK